MSLIKDLCETCDNFIPSPAFISITLDCFLIGHINKPVLVIRGRGLQEACPHPFGWLMISHSVQVMSL